MISPPDSGRKYTSSEGSRIVGMSSGSPAGLVIEVLVRHRDDRDVDAGERPDLARIHASGVDDDLGLDLAPIGLDRLDPPAPDAGHR